MRKKRRQWNKEKEREGKKWREEWEIMGRVKKGKEREERKGKIGKGED